MKVWKMVGCVALLAVIICGCVILAQNAEVSAEHTEENDAPTQENSAPTQDEQAQDEEALQGSTVITPTYSEGLAFRSNGDGTCAVSGIGSCTAACILIPPQSPAGDTVVEILPYAFANSIVGAIELPATLSQLSAASFAGCQRLSVVRVAAGNTAFSEHDGVLYTAEGGTLLYCPSGRTAPELHLHPALRRITAGAFADCGTLSDVYFAGSTSEWHALIVGDGNEALYRAALHFNAA